MNLVEIFMLARRVVWITSILLVSFVLAKYLGGRQSAPLAAQLEPEVKQRTHDVATFSDPEINESSGLVRSVLYADCFWTHNDSGDRPRVFLVDKSGNTLVRLRIDGAKAIDWEDIAIVKHESKSWLVIGDIGGNAQPRDTVTLYIVAEPKVDFVGRRPDAKILELNAPVASTVQVRIPGGVTNYESVAIDPTDQSIVLFEKRVTGGRVFAVPFPKTTEDGLEREVVSDATQIASTAIPVATACDISDDGSQLVVITYNYGFLYTRKKSDGGKFEEWKDALKRDPQSFALPVLRQMEAVCFSSDAKSLFLTSEMLPAPLVQMDIPAPSPSE